MEYKNLGRSDLQISRIGFGCMSLPVGNSGNESLLQQAFELGINYFDTADIYDEGENEKTVGRAFKTTRDKVIIATKVGNIWRPDGSGFDWAPSKKYIIAQVENSLRRLQSDYIDLYQMHGGTINDNTEEIIEALEQLVHAGKIRYYGISSIRPNVIQRFVTLSNMVSVMMQYSLLDRRPEETCLDLLGGNNIGVLARGSLARGLLITKPAKPYLEQSVDEVKKAANAIQNISTEKRNAAQTAIRFVLHNPAISAAVIGIRTEKQLMDAIKTLQTPQLTQDEINRLYEVATARLYVDHRE